MRRPTGSSADVGSSSSSRRGSPTSACAMPSRCAMPFDIPSTRRSAASVERDELEQASPLGGAAARAGEPLVQLEHLVGRVPAGEAEELGQVAERCARGARAGARPGDRRLCRPSGARARQAIFTSVDLPAPFGPSRPTSSPSPTSQIDTLQRLDGAVALTQPADGESIGHAATVLWVYATRLHGGPGVRRGRTARRGARTRGPMSGRQRRSSRRLRLRRPRSRSRTSSAGAWTSTRTSFSPRAKPGA